jgi:hypothetical protein
MDNVTLIRVVSGILTVVVLVILIYRMKKKASANSLGVR